MYWQDNPVIPEGRMLPVYLREELEKHNPLTWEMVWRLIERRGLLPPTKHDTRYESEELKIFCLQWTAIYDQAAEMIKILRSHNVEAIRRDDEEREEARRKGY